MNRRDLMKWVLAAPISGALVTGSITDLAASELGRRVHRVPRPEILDVVGTRDRTKAIAEAYRRARPSESLDEIERAVRSAAAPHGRLGPIGADAIRRLVRRDYAKGRTLELDGWILAETEARQCVLYETAHSPSA